jgi:assimilatory nitrate reductase catalytic subunit
MRTPPPARGATPGCGRRLVAVLYVTLTGRLPPRDWLAELFAEPVLSRRGPLGPAVRPPARRAGRQGAAGLRLPEGRRQGRAGRHRRRGRHPDAVGAATGAGTNCGSCRPEIARMIAAAVPLPPRSPLHV